MYVIKAKDVCYMNDYVNQALNQFRSAQNSDQAIIALMPLERDQLICVAESCGLDVTRRDSKNLIRRRLCEQRFGRIE